MNDLLDPMDIEHFEAMEVLDGMLEKMEEICFSQGANSEEVMERLLAARAAIVEHVQKMVGSRDQVANAWRLWAQHLNFSVECNGGSAFIEDEQLEPCECIVGNYCEEGKRHRSNVSRLVGIDALE